MVLPSGVLPPVPADVLSSQRMMDVIGVLKARAHYILFDAPPVLAATDAALLGAKLDGVVLVVRVGATRRDQAARARQALERVHVRVLGAVMTNAPRESTEVINCACRAAAALILRRLKNGALCRKISRRVTRCRRDGRPAHAVGSLLIGFGILVLLALVVSLLWGVNCVFAAGGRFGRPHHVT